MRIFGSNSTFGGFRAALLFLALGVAVQPANAQVSSNPDDYFFLGNVTLIELSGTDLTQAAEFNEFDDLSTSQVGSFTDPTAWGYVFGGGTLVPYRTAPPGADDSVYILGFPAGFENLVNGPTATASNGDTIGGYYGTYTGGGGFQVTNVTGTVATFSASGPGTLTLAGLNVTGITSFASVGGIGILQTLPGDAFGQGGGAQLTGFAPSVQTINGGSLTTPTLYLAAGTDLAPADIERFPITTLPDPVADAGSLIISGATLSGAVTQITGVPTSNAGYGSSNAAGTGGVVIPGVDPFTLQQYNTEAYSTAPVLLTQGATLNAQTELDIVGVDPALYPNATGTTTLSANASTITAGVVVIATGAGGYGTGSAGVPAELDLAAASTLTATTLVVGDTGNGTFNVSGGSMITDQQAIIGNATGSTGTATIDGSTWTNNGYLTVGNNGIGTLTIQNGAQVTTTGQYGNIFIAGLAGSSDSAIIVTGGGSLLQSSGYFVIAEDGTGDGIASLTVEDNARVVTGDVMYLGEVQGATGVVGISGGATVTNNTTGTYGTSSTVLGVVSGSYGYLYIDGAGSQLKSTGDMSIGYDGTGYANITNGGSLEVDGTIVRVGRDENSYGSLTVTGDQSSFTASNATLYIGYQGTGAVTVEGGANLTVMATNIGGSATGMGTLTIDGENTTASLGEISIGAGGQGELDVTGGANVTTGNIMIGTTEGDAGMFMFAGSTTNVIADGDATIGDDDVGKAAGSNEAALSVQSLTVGGESTGVGTLTLDTGATITTSGDATVGDKEGSQGTVTIGLTAGAELTVGGNLTVGGGGAGTLQINPGSTLTIQGDTVTIGDESTGSGVVTINGGTLSFGGKLVVGSSGSGTLNMQEGATNDLGGISLNTPDVTLGEETSGSGTLNVDGTGTDFQVGMLTVGESGQGALTVSNAAVLTASGAVSVGDQLSGVISTVTVETSGMFAINNNLTVGGGSIATMDVRTGGQVNVIGDTSIGDNPNGAGFLTVEGVAQTGGTPSSFGYGGKLTVGNYGAGTLNITGGGYVAPTPGGAGEVDIASQSAGTSTGQVTVSGSDSNSQTASELDATNLAVGGTMKAAGGTGNLTASDGGVVKVKTTLQTWSKGTVDVSGGGSVTVGTGAVAAAGSVRIDVGGTLGGGGTIDGNVVNAGGTVAPGDPMALTINGDYTQTCGVLEIQIGGTGVGEFDSIAATGNISITDATIDLDFIDGFAPTQGETFDLLTSSLGTSASDLTFDISGLESGFQFDTTTNSTPDILVLTADNNGMATPEPSTLVLLGLGLGAFACYRRRQAVARSQLAG